MKQIQDHKGNQFSSIKEMCEYWKIPLKTYSYRIKKGYTIEDALSHEKKGKMCQDHEGNTFLSIRAMCKYWNISINTYKTRINKGCTIKEALSCEECQDHQGNTFPSVRAMCKYWNIPIKTYNDYIKNGCTVEEALTYEECQDHQGNTFSSVGAMCKYWNVSINAYYDRIEKGYTIEETLLSENKGTLCQDHQGNTFPSVRAMCRHWDIPAKTYHDRIKKGYTIEEALSYHEYQDHEGNVFPSVSAMCKYWNILVSTYSDRIKKGYTIEEALSPERKIKNGVNCKDHQGNVFSSINAMCKYWNIPTKKYSYYINKGYTIEEALTYKQNRTTIQDHQGNTFSSMKEMCEYWNVPIKTYSARIKKGYTIEKALSYEEFQDHKGNIFPSISAMCRYWKISETTYLDRIKKGCTIEEALSKERKMKSGNICQDHQGNTFSSVKTMCKYWKVPITTYYERIKKGYTIREALLSNNEERTTKNDKCQDHQGNTFPSIKEMCEYWNITDDTYHSRIRAGYTIEEALTKGKNIKRTTQCQDHQGNIFSSVREMCKYWNVPTTTYYDRIKKGYTIEQTLTYDKQKNHQMYKTCKECKDHKGNIYPSYVLMCEAYGIDYSVFEKRIKKGFTLERALTQKIIKRNYDNTKTHKNKLNPTGGHPKRIQDHKGNEYNSITEMCKAYNIVPSVYYGRINRGWKLKEALEISHTRTDCSTR